MDHQEASTGYLDFVAGHGDHGCGGGCEAKHLHRHLGRMLPQQVVDCETLEIVSARTVHVDDDILPADRAQSCGNPLRSDTPARPPVLADHIEDRDRSVIILLGSTNVRVPPAQCCWHDLSAKAGARCDLSLRQLTLAHCLASPD